MAKQPEFHIRRALGLYGKEKKLEGIYEEKKEQHKDEVVGKARQSLAKISLRKAQAKAALQKASG